MRRKYIPGQAGICTSCRRVLDIDFNRSPDISTLPEFQLTASSCIRCQIVLAGICNLSAFRANVAESNVKVFVMHKRMMHSKSTFAGQLRLQNQITHPAENFSWKCTLILVFSDTICLSHAIKAFTIHFRNLAL